MAFVGRGSGDSLDLGCGEGRVSRMLKQCGYRVTAADPVPALLHAERDVGSADSYTIASGSELPYRDASFDLVMAYNMLMDADDLPGTVREVRRVPRPSGLLVASIVHPFSERRRFATRETTSQFVIPDGYFGVRRFDDAEAHNGMRMHFAGWSRPLEDYASALEDVGLAIVAIRKPVPATPAGWDDMRRWTRSPLFLWSKARPLTAR